MALEVIMPKAGVDMTEGQIVQWNKKVGEFVKEGEILLEIMTDKVSMELEAEEDGYLIAILKGDGETVPVTEVIGYLGEEGENIPTAGGSAPAEAPAPATPAAIYTLPEVAAVGLTEEQAREKYDVAIGKFNFAANGRAIASDAAQGFVKVIADKKYGEVLGVHIIGPAAAELINEASTIIEMEITVEEMLKTIHGHPTFSEVMYEAFADVLGLAVHSPKKK